MSLFDVLPTQDATFVDSRLRLWVCLCNNMNVIFVLSKNLFVVAKLIGWKNLMNTVWEKHFVSRKLLRIIFKFLKNVQNVFCYKDNFAVFFNLFPDSYEKIQAWRVMEN